MKNTVIVAMAILLLALFSLMANAESVNINTATAKEIATAIKGVGIKKANAIVSYREKNGPFQTIDEITKVSGVGIKTLQQNQSNLTVDAPTTSTTITTGTQKTSKTDENTSGSKNF
jgi:competence protein ComEA